MTYDAMTVTEAECVLVTAEPLLLPEEQEMVDVEAAMTSATAEVVPESTVFHGVAEGTIDHTTSMLEVTAQAVVDLEAGGSTTHTSVTQTETRPQYLSATIIKATPEFKIGLGLRQYQDGSLRITFIRDASALSSSPLKVGDRILSINGKSCSAMTKLTAIRLLSSTSGYVTLVAFNPDGNPNHVETMVEKPSQDHPVGLGLGRSNQGSLQVSSVTLDGLFSHSILNVGDRVLAINQQGCDRLEPRAAIDLIRSMDGHVTLLTVTKGVVHAAASGNASDTGILSATATADLVGVSKASMIPRHLCFCTWLLILSMVILSAIIFVKGK